jgi:hypothetical protein
MRPTMLRRDRKKGRSLRGCLPTAQSLPVQIERKIGTSRFQGSYLNLAQFMARGEPHLGGEREVEVKPMATPLILKRASVSRPSGQWRDDDYAVLENGVVVGRIFKVPVAPPDRPWMWASGNSAVPSSALALFFGFHRASGVSERDSCNQGDDPRQPQGIALPLRALAQLAQDEESGCTGGEARARGGLGQAVIKSPALLQAGLSEGVHSTMKEDPYSPK